MLFQLRHLHGPALAVAIIIAVLTISGVAYAATILWSVVNEGVNESGRQEYVVHGVETCQNNGGANTLNRYEIKKDAPKLSDEESKKIIRAACEIGLGNQLAEKLQSNFAPRKKPIEGEAMRYVMPGDTGVLKAVTDSQITVEAYGQTVTYETARGRTYQIYDTQLQATSQPLKIGDVVSPVSLVSITYGKEFIRSADASGQNLFGVVKLSLPIEYYTKYQAYITEIPTCIGNTDELCPNTASVDVYPRGEGEGSQNKQLKIQEGEIVKQISGKVVQVDASSATFETRKGTRYTVTVESSAIDTFNTSYAQAYNDVDVRVVPGSSIMVRYYESPADSSKNIGHTKVASIILLLEGKSPKESLKPY